MGRAARAGDQIQPALGLRTAALRLVFAGTPATAVPSLTALLRSRHEVVAVVTRPDAAAGRGRRVARSAIGCLADDRGIPVLTPRRPGEPDFLAALAELAPDACPVVAYGGLIPPAALRIPRHGWVNLHFSLLPAWRGAAPVQRALIAGDDVTGATTFRLEAGLDTGPVYGVVTESVRPRDTAGDLLARLAECGAGLLVATVDGIEDGTLQARPQPAEGVSHAPKLGPADARVDWAAPAEAVDRRVRGCTPEPGAWSNFRGQRLKLGPVRPVAAAEPPPLVAEQPLTAGQVLVQRHRVLAGTATGPVELGDVQPPGKRAVPAADWARGARLQPGEAFGSGS